MEKQVFRMYRKTKFVLIFSVISLIFSLLLIFTLEKKDWLLPFICIFTLGAGLFAFDTERKARR